MKKNIEILINNKTIEVHFNKELKNHKIILKFEIVNSYQLICMNYEIISKNSIELSSTDIRNINIHTLIKDQSKQLNHIKILILKILNQKQKACKKIMFHTRNL